MTAVAPNASAGPPELPGHANFDVAIIGGGLSGSALAVHLARTGRRVAVFERDRFPRDKLCGEFLSPESGALLRELGCLDKVLDRGATPIRRARFTSTRGRVLEFPLPGEALGISRATLDEIVFRQAASSGARTFEASAVRGTRERCAEGGRWIELDIERREDGARPLRVSMDARCLVGAYGRDGRIDGERPKAAGEARRFDRCVGLKKHHRPVDSADGSRLRDELRHTVEIHAVEGGYCGLSFVENDTVNVCMLLRKRTITSLPSSRWPDVRRFLESQNRLLGRRLDGLSPTDRPQIAAGRVPAFAREPAGGHVLRIGDAAGMIAPLCGDGQAMALSSAKLLGELMTRLPSELDARERARLLRAWRRSWRRRYATRLRIGRLLQRVVLEPTVAHVAFGVLQLFPGLVSRLVRWTRE